MVTCAWGELGSRHKEVWQWGGSGGRRGPSHALPPMRNRAVRTERQLVQRVVQQVCKTWGQVWRLGMSEKPPTAALLACPTWCLSGPANHCEKVPP